MRGWRGVFCVFGMGHVKIPVGFTRLEKGTAVAYFCGGVCASGSSRFTANIYFTLRGAAL